MTSNVKLTGRRSALAAGVLVALAAASVWTWWPAAVELARTWAREPDYSHGFIVLPLALLFLWLRRNRFPRDEIRPAWGGFLLMLAAQGLRVGGARYYLGLSVEGWSLICWIAALVWLFGGRRLLYWALPALGFLLFMVPLPFRVERWLRLPLQRVATVVSTFVLQCFGQPALAEGNTILLGQRQLEVAQACSGLRMFVGILALAVALVIAVPRPRWQKMVLLASTLPVALLVNCVRIVSTALVYRYAAKSLNEQLIHDVAGWGMIVLAATLFAAILVYLNLLVRQLEVMDAGELVAHSRSK